MVKKKRNGIKKFATIKFVGGLILLFALIVSFLIPIETVQVGECKAPYPTRLSLLFDGAKKIEQAKKEVEERKLQREKYEKEHPGVALGCSIGPTYQLHLFF